MTELRKMRENQGLTAIELARRAGTREMRIYASNANVFGRRKMKRAGSHRCWGSVSIRYSPEQNMNRKAVRHEPSNRSREGIDGHFAG